jgi:hypothetical protein
MHDALDRRMSSRVASHDATKAKDDADMEELRLLLKEEEAMAGATDEDPEDKKEEEEKEEKAEDAEFVEPTSEDSEEEEEEEKKVKANDASNLIAQLRPHVARLRDDGFKKTFANIVAQATDSKPTPKKNVEGYGKFAKAARKTGPLVSANDAFTQGQDPAEITRLNEAYARRLRGEPVIQEGKK